MNIQEAFDIYLDLVDDNNVVAAEQFAASLSDEIAKAVYELACKDDRTNTKLVRPLWYNYTTQAFRWGK